MQNIITTSINIKNSDINTAIARYLAAICEVDYEPSPSNQPKVYQGQINRIALPVGNFIVFTPISSTNISTPSEENYNDNGVVKTRIFLVKSITMQVDFYGEKAQDNAELLHIYWRSFASVETMHFINPYITPLYTDDFQQTRFVNAEAQYENRCSITITLQANQVVSDNAEYFNKVNYEVIQADKEPQ